MADDQHRMVGAADKIFENDEMQIVGGETCRAQQLQLGDRIILAIARAAAKRLGHGRPAVFLSVRTRVGEEGDLRIHEGVRRKDRIVAIERGERSGDLGALTQRRVGQGGAYACIEGRARQRERDRPEDVRTGGMRAARGRQRQERIGEGETCLHERGSSDRVGRAALARHHPVKRRHATIRSLRSRRGADRQRGRRGIERGFARERGRRYETGEQTVQEKGEARDHEARFRRPSRRSA